ncbi:MAG: VWA domain-containing protein [Candidatus Cloacimonetes bacterium]|nr:VWA domain-containing protein [Candidatus Cloacimonadota bacterium]MBL7085674.1 VWA domain-containing protein [Candidatus Cloacimonadota bacterium]
MKIEFLNPQFFWLFFIIPILILYEIFIKSRKKPSVLYSDITILKSVKNRKTILLYYLRYIFRLVVFTMLILALAKPVIPERFTKVKGKGVDIILAIDVSTSMRAIDFQPNNRLYAAKEEAKSFIDMRPNDRIGLVIFAGESYTQCPLTIDHNILIELLNQIKTGMVEDGTAIGMGIATSINRLRDSKAKSKVIILLTDGRNNSGEIDPVTAAELAKEFKIKIYPIGVGKEGKSKIPIDHPIYGRQYVTERLDIDMATLNKIAEICGTKTANRAQNSTQLKNIMNEIDKFEKTEISEKVHYKYYNLFYYFLYFALILLIFELFYSKILCRALP